jgi:hypothetical protein
LGHRLGKIKWEDEKEKRNSVELPHTSHTMSQTTPPTTRQRNTPAAAEKSMKELENAEDISMDICSKEQAIKFLQTKDLQTLAHVLLQVGNALTKIPRIVIDGIRVVAFLMADAGVQQMANEILAMITWQLQDQMETFNVNIDTMRDAVEHIMNAA